MSTRNPSSSGLPTGDNVTRTVLPDGTVLLAHRNPATAGVTIQGMLGVGAADVPTELSGLSRIHAEALTRGTRNRSARELAEAAESVGASFGFAGTTHALRFSAKCLSEDTPLLLDLMSDMLRNPVFPDDEVELVRGELLVEIEERDQDTRAVSEMAFRGAVYPEGHPYSRSTEATEEKVNAITVADLASFHAAHATAHALTLALVGDIDPETVAEMVERTWFPASAGRTPIPDSLPPLSGTREKLLRHEVVPGKVQTDITWGGHGPSRTHPDYMAASMANLVLGGFAMMGRLGQSVREEQGLAYYATSRLAISGGPGPWVCIAGVSPEDREQAIASMETEVVKLINEPVSEEELEDCRSYLTGSLPLRLESSEGIASAMLDIEWNRLGPDYLLRYPDLVRSVMPDDIQRVTRYYLAPERAVCITAGPAVG